VRRKNDGIVILTAEQQRQTAERASRLIVDPPPVRDINHGARGYLLTRRETRFVMEAAYPKIATIITAAPQSAEATTTARRVDFFKPELATTGRRRRLRQNDTSDRRRTRRGKAGGGEIRRPKRCRSMRYEA
jgi:hypothetical protein